jgi:hypothetical protein
MSKTNLSVRRTSYGIGESSNALSREKIDMGQPIIQFEIMGKDARKLQKFYADLFNWK